MEDAANRSLFPLQREDSGVPTTALPQRRHRATCPSLVVTGPSGSWSLQRLARWETPRRPIFTGWCEFQPPTGRTFQTGCVCTAHWTNLVVIAVHRTECPSALSGSASFPLKRRHLKLACSFEAPNEAFAGFPLVRVHHEIFHIKMSRKEKTLAPLQHPRRNK